MTSDRELIPAVVVRRTDPEDAVTIPHEPAVLAGLCPQLVLEPAKDYDVRLSFWLHVIVPEGASIEAAPWYEIDDRRIVGAWVACDTADHEAGRGQIRGEQVFSGVAAADGALIAGLLIAGSGAYTVGHVSALAWDPALADSIVTATARS